MKFAETQQTLPLVTEEYGRQQVAMLEDDGGTPEAEECQDLLEGVDLMTLDKETVAALFEELKEPDMLDSGLDFVPGQ